jgi:HemY protein
MARLISFFVIVGLLVAGTVWLADRPGNVSLVWLGWRVDTSVPILLLALFLALSALFAMLRLLGGIFELPGRFLANRREGRRRKGYLALTDGLAAVAAGDTDQARRLAKRAGNLLSDSSLTTLLSAQAADLSGDQEAARGHYNTLLDRPETAPLGLKGLMTLALRRGDRGQALEFARRAYAINPETPGLAPVLFDLQAEAGQWAEAESTVTRALKQGSIDAEEGRRKRAVALHERAGRAMAQQDEDVAWRLEQQAHNSDPGFTAAALRMAEWARRRGRPRNGLKAIETAWKVAPHPALAESYLDLSGAPSDLERVRKIEALAKVNPDHPDSHLAIAKAALRAKLWGQARTHLGIVAKLRPSAEGYRLLAELEEKERGDVQAAKDWLAKAALSSADPAWHCLRCGETPVQWQANCPACGALDTLSWTSAAPPGPPALAATAG